MKSTLIVVCALIAVQPGFAKDKVNTKGQKKAKHGGVVVNARAPAAKPSAAAKTSPPKAQPWVGRNVAISPSEQHVIRTYVFECVQASKIKPSGLPPGLAKKVTWGWGALPAGWQQRCAKGQVLPADIHKHCQPLPHEIILKLPPPPPGTVLLAVDGKVLRVAYPTYEILDVFDAH